MIANDAKRGKWALVYHLELVDPRARSCSDGTKTVRVLSVTKDVPPDAMVAEAPAKIRRKSEASRGRLSLIEGAPWFELA
jgi:hypothetical protein